MNIRVMLMLNFLSFVSANAMWNKFTNWFEDPTPHMAIKCVHTEDTTSKNMYFLILDAARKGFPEIKVEEGTPIVEAMLFNAKAKRKAQKYDPKYRYDIIHHYHVYHFYIPIELCNDWKENNNIILDVPEYKTNQIIFCDQKSIDPKMSIQESLDGFKK